MVGTLSICLDLRQLASQLFGLLQRFLEYGEGSTNGILPFFCEATWTAHVLSKLQSAALEQQGAELSSSSLSAVT